MRDGCERTHPRAKSEELEVSERGKVKGKVFVMACMNTKVGGEAVGYGSSSWTAAVN